MLLRRHWLRILAHLGGLIPLALLIWDYAHDDLTFNPIQEATLRTGKTALVFLVLSLVCTPLSLLGVRQAAAARRPLGLYAFLYAALHFLIFIAIDYGFDLDLVFAELAEKRYVLAGFAAFLLLIPLALTSTKGWMRRLGRRWKQLHRLVYVAAPLAVLHYVWLVKSDVREPLLYGAAVLVLLGLRLPPARRALGRLRSASPGAPRHPLHEPRREGLTESPLPPQRERDQG